MLYECTIRVYLPNGTFNDVSYRGASPNHCLNTAKAAFGGCRCAVLESRIV